jgi:hypothetical protein
MTPSTLHALFRQLVPESTVELQRGLMSHEADWRQWMACGFKEEDLRLVIGYLNHQIKHNHWHKFSRAFTNVICSPKRFEDLLSEAKAEQRQREGQKPMGTVSVVTATGQVRARTVMRPEARRFDEIVAEHLANMRAAVEKAPDL